MQKRNVFCHKTQIKKKNIVKCFRSCRVHEVFINIGVGNSHESVCIYSHQNHMGMKAEVIVLHRCSVDTCIEWSS